MTKQMQKIVLLIEPNEKEFERPTSIGNLYLNRFTIEEEAANEIINIYELPKSTGDLTLGEYEEKGMNLKILTTYYFYMISHFLSAYLQYLSAKKWHDKYLESNYSFEKIRQNVSLFDVSVFDNRLYVIVLNIVKYSLGE